MERAEHHEQGPAHLDRRVEVYRRAPFPLYGLSESFTGPRALGECATTEEDGHETIDALGLSHGSHLDTTQPHLAVITATPNGAPDPVDALAGETGVVLVDAATPAEVTATLGRTLGAVHPIRRQIRIDGQPVDAQGLEAGASWVLQMPTGSQLVTVTATNWPPDDVTLVRVVELDPYIGGTRQLLADRSSER